MESRLAEVTRLFLKLGFTAFGGPAAHIALFHDETVQRRKWLDDQEFLDLLGATNLIPGPNSTEMAIHLGYRRAGWAGLLLGGASFILPATGIVLALAWAYTRYGTTPEVGWILYGVKPVVIAVILQALVSLAPKAFRTLPLAAAGLTACIFYFISVHPLTALLGIGLLFMLAGLGSTWWKERVLSRGPFALLLPLAVPPVSTAPFSQAILFLTFLKIGSVLYGSGYVLLAFLQADLVDRLGWLTTEQLLDAIAIGQVTPGPVFTTATFIGYLLGGVPGALLSTLGIFLPSFFFVALSNRIVPSLRRRKWTALLLDGVNAASLGLMAAVTIELGRASLIDPLTFLIALVALILLLRWKVNATWLILGGALLGFLSFQL